MGSTKIEWTDATWNPVTGCTPIAAGCKNCWAKRMVGRLAGRYGYSATEPFRPTLHADRMAEPLLWRKPRRIAVSLMGDLFHDGAKEVWIDMVFGIMSVAYSWNLGHTFQVLTKRPERMQEYLLRGDRCKRVIAAGRELARGCGPDLMNAAAVTVWPLPNVWLGCSASTQPDLDHVVSHLLKCPAAVRFLSLEPLLGPITVPLEWEPSGSPDRLFGGRFYGLHTPIRTGIDWVIVGGESGPGARPMHPDWARSLRDQCQAAGVPFFFKQHGEWAPSCQLPPSTTDVATDKSTWMNSFGEIGKPSVGDDGFENCIRFWRVGKKAAGRLLDGREWNELPKTAR